LEFGIDPNASIMNIKSSDGFVVNDVFVMVLVNSKKNVGI
jgi:hypothetical protein